jgi:hypothetical protein
MIGSERGERAMAWPFINADTKHRHAPHLLCCACTRTCALRLMLACHLGLGHGASGPSIISE